MIKKRILIIGSNGMLGQSLTTHFMFKKDVELTCASFEDESFYDNVAYAKIDISSSKEVKNLIKNFCPDAIINSAAYTNVDGCETEKELSWSINVTGVENIVKYARTCDAHFIHISSDYIFDGEAGPYSEDEKPNPISHYGKEKLAAENVIKAGRVKHTIVRTNVLYGATQFGRPDFVKWVYNSLSEKKKIKIVKDQINNPTYIDDLSSAISKIIEFGKEGVYNIGGADTLTRLDFTYKIADYFELDKTLITPIVTSDLNQPAPRPLNSGLINLKAETEVNYHPLSIDKTLFLMKRSLVKN
ncbi:MAG: dTDP-4-dehydrorhamnose reductase [Melioribacteraceae bacterium]|jgi:dTDP-4-dehydrorhamnose reductase|nr:dTDP-4-dehydrorhamnose reductase [Melioribacteraceae bacterium]